MSYAYHVVVHAMEGSVWRSDADRFGAALLTCLDGHLPCDRYLDVCRQVPRVNDSRLASLISEALMCDLNPMTQMAMRVSSLHRFQAAFNHYNQEAGLGVATYLEGVGPTGISAQRRAQTDRARDVALGREATMTMAKVLVNGIGRGAGNSRPVSGLARELTASKLIEDAAMYFEQAPGAKVQDLAKRLGCSARTVLRGFVELGVTPSHLRQACMLVHASSRMGSAASLTDIAMEAGYSDLAHFTRVFRKATHLSPHALRLAAFDR